jgi:hypothetical protein
VRRGPTADGQVVSATRREAWVACPHAYFLRYVLGVREIETPDDVVELSPLDLGSLVHRVLERFVAEGDDLDPARLRRVTDEECARVELAGLAGRRLLWERDQRHLHAHLTAWLAAEEVFRADRGVEELGTECSFDGVEVGLPSGRRVRFRGRIDRLVRAKDGRLVVIDYKTGRPDGYRGLGPDNPVGGGSCLQLAVYALGARQVAAAPAADVEASYWFVGRGKNETIGLVVDDAAHAELGATVGAIVAGIEAGCFPAHPVPPGPRGPWVPCRACDPDGLGTGDRWRELERKWADPALAPFRVFAEEEPDEVVDLAGAGDEVRVP